MDTIARLNAALAGRYTIERELGAGGMATVFLARDLKHDRHVALKVLKPELGAAIGGERFLREIRVEAQLRHPHIVMLIDSGDADGLLYYVMPYVQGQSLRQRLVEKGRLSVGESVRIWRDAIEAIAYAHRHGIVHRDIKPENILLSEEHAVVVDFGIAKALVDAAAGETLTGIGLAVGTPAYMSPEQAAGDAEVDHRADIYALGVIAYEMLTGQAPFSGMTPQSLLAAHVLQQPEPIEKVAADVPPQLANVIRRCMEKDRDRRWQSVDELKTALDEYEAALGGTRSGLWLRMTGTPRARRSFGLAAGIAILLLGGTGYSVTAQQRRVRWSHDVAMPELRRLADARITDSAFLLAARVRAILPSDRELATLSSRFTVPATLRSSPEGARVYWTAYRGDTANWVYLGTTPLDSASVPTPVAEVSLLLKFERPGYVTAVRPFFTTRSDKAPVALDSALNVASDMVRVPGGSEMVFRSDIRRAAILSMSSFLMDKYEVTNREFKKFVDAGGYHRQELWNEVFMSAGKTLKWDEAVARFTDRTGRPGPAAWEGGGIPGGQDDYPVSGVSWYEAAAYARFAAKQLPTIYQWRKAAGLSASAWIVPRSNIEGKAMARVGTGAMSPFGTFDMAGNAREWCVNADGAKRYILGGGWNDLNYMFSHVVTEDPFDRSITNGIRLVKPLDPDSNAALLAGPSPRGFRDYSKEKPVGDVVYREFLRMYDFDRAAMNARVDASDSTNQGWIRQTITFDAAYGQERVTAYLFLPRGFAAPYQTVVYFPGSGVIGAGSSKNVGPPLPFVVTSGRALLYPVYKDTYERGSADADFITGPVHNMSGELLGPNTYRDHVVMWTKDLRRAVDYLSTRADVDTARLAYVGLSWGSRLAAINLALEPRFKVSVLYLAGFMTAPRRPEVDEINFLPHVTIPTLVMSGKYDDIFPLQTAAVPFFQLLGTPPDRKQQKLYPTQHFLPRDEQIRETLNWLDRYLGPVKASAR